MTIVTSRIALTFALFVTVALTASCDDGGGNPPPADSGPTVDTNTAAVCMGGTVAYLAACTAAAECGTSCDCRLFGHSMVCTKACIDNPDCPAPSGGCSGGFCRP